MFRKCLNFLKARIRKYIMEEYWLSDYIAMGMKVGSNTHIQPGLVVDSSHCWLIEIGNNVGIAPEVYLLAHDVNTMSVMGYVKIGKIVIRDNAHIGARSLIMPGVTIGENSIIGAGSVVTKSIPDNVVAAGNPAKIICTLDEYRTKVLEVFKNAPKFSEEYTLRGGIDDARKKEMNALLNNRLGLVK